MNKRNSVEAHTHTHIHNPPSCQTQTITHPPYPSRRVKRKPLLLLHSIQIPFCLRHHLTIRARISLVSYSHHSRTHPTMKRYKTQAEAQRARREREKWLTCTCRVPFSRFRIKRTNWTNEHETVGQRQAVNVVCVCVKMVLSKGKAIQRFDRTHTKNVDEKKNTTTTSKKKKKESHSLTDTQSQQNSEQDSFRSAK